MGIGYLRIVIAAAAMAHAESTRAKGHRQAMANLNHKMEAAGFVGPGASGITGDTPLANRIPESWGLVTPQVGLTPAPPASSIPPTRPEQFRDCWLDRRVLG